MGSEGVRVGGGGCWTGQTGSPEHHGRLYETVGKALFFNISALRSKLNMVQHNDLVGIVILKVSI